MCVCVCVLGIHTHGGQPEGLSAKGEMLVLLAGVIVAEEQKDADKSLGGRAGVGGMKSSISEK